MDRLDRFFGTEGRALGLRSQRLTVLASNIANAATPNYKARDLDFTAVLAPEPGGLALARTSAAHLAAGDSASGPTLRYRIPVQPSLDGNTVELATEQLQFAETAVRYRSSLEILNGRIQTLVAAMKSE
jgi:flagellar basal-body rod protein FlgB